MKILDDLQAEVDRSQDPAWSLQAGLTLIACIRELRGHIRMFNKCLLPDDPVCLIADKIIEKHLFPLLPGGDDPLAKPKCDKCGGAGSVYDPAQDIGKVCDKCNGGVPK